jgi:hypothetical protein
VIVQAVACLIGRRRKRHKRRHKLRKVAGDKGYSGLRVRDWIKRQKIEPVIPYKDTELARWDPAVKFDRETYRGRGVVEQCVGFCRPGLLYVGFNAVVSTIAFLTLLYTAGSGIGTNAMNQIKYTVLGGLGGVVLLRTTIVSPKGEGPAAQIGPEM